MAQHISIRVPWTDNDYCGCICNNPTCNTSCLRLKNISENKNAVQEQEYAGCKMVDMDFESPCIAEGGAFMCSNSLSRTVNHPYKMSGNPSHKHFAPTNLDYPAFSLPARPFGWTMLNKGDADKYANIDSLSAKFDINFDKSREPNLGFETIWIQDKQNQRAVFDSFYKDVIAKKSLVIPYAKQVPFSEDTKRVIIGVGFVENITIPPEYKYSGSGEIRSILWETMLEHSIRPERKNGFLLPYNEMLNYAKTHPEFDLESVIVYADDEYFEEFSYATEHLSHDAVMSVLLKIIKALEIIKKCVPGNWDECIAWTKARCEEVSKDRGLYPGASEVLTAMGFEKSYSIVREVKSNISTDEQFFKSLKHAIEKPADYLSPEIAISIKKTEQQAFLSIDELREEFIQLLSRFSLSTLQAEILINKGYRNKKSKYVSVDAIQSPDECFVENPYLLYLNTRLLRPEFRISLHNVDRAVFAKSSSSQSYLSSPNDEKRILAIMVYILEQKALMGHTVYPLNNLISDMNNLPMSPQLTVTPDIIKSINYRNEIIAKTISNGQIVFKLSRLDEVDNVILRAVEKRVKTANRHTVNENWENIVNQAFIDTKFSTEEQRAREEKTAILKELAEARLSVLIGSAGTGKTTLLSLLCKAKQISDGGILLLAPTGKSRVRLGQAMRKQNVDFNAQTVAQFLMANNRFDYDTMIYHLSDTPAPTLPQTVIVDECSMLTEEMFGALLQTLSKVHRIILVGDPNQLPPIGAGRPFTDLVNFLRKDINKFPRVGNSFGELTIPRRQKDENDKRFDLSLAKWFTNSDNTDLDDEIFNELQNNQCSSNISFKKWESTEQLQKLVLETISEETGMSDINDLDGFDFSLGGKVKDVWMNFGETIEKIEDWQILSPYRNDVEIGTSYINQIIHSQYRDKNLPSGIKHKYKKRKTEHPLGSDGIIYGDKVINIRNQTKSGYSSQNCLNYIANGEVGIVENIITKNNQHQIRFSSQPESNYRFSSKNSDDTESDLELAYALTIHKAQGSEFKKVILILSDTCKLISKELLYTAITRQSEKLIILYNRDASDLKRFSSSEYSATALRLTDLFEQPSAIEHKNTLYENCLIHRTANKEFVRSKSEVIIADALHDSHIDYTYEKPLTLNDGKTYYPDFTIDDAESGMIFYWEHCGMMDNKVYSDRWKNKKKLYENNGIIEGINLIVTYDDKGAIDSHEIRNIIKKFF
ncbi:MAG: AAA family ATPase [Clostridia bacterium]|nr:AAA family ATPase [Clostridia bacterium]